MRNAKWPKLATVRHFFLPAEGEQERQEADRGVEKNIEGAGGGSSMAMATTLEITEASPDAAGSPWTTGVQQQLDGAQAD